MQKGNLDIYRKLYEYLKECQSSDVKRLSAFITEKKSCHRTQSQMGIISVNYMKSICLGKKYVLMKDPEAAKELS